MENKKKRQADIMSTECLWSARCFIYVDSHLFLTNLRSRQYSLHFIQMKKLKLSKTNHLYDLKQEHVAKQDSEILSTASNPRLHHTW